MQIDREEVEAVTDFILLGSKVTEDDNCNHKIKRRLLLEGKNMTNLDSILKSRDIALMTKVYIVKAMFFPVVTYGASLVAQLVENPHAMQKTPAQFLGWEDPLEKVPTPVFWPGECHGLLSPWGCKELDTTTKR